MRPGVVVPLALLALTASVYHEVGRHEFVDYDDPVLIVHHPAHRAPLSATTVTAALTRAYHLNWVPLTSLSLQLDAALFDSRAGPTLIVNAALHALAAMLLWAALARMTGAPWRSGFVAAVFAVHPLHVESVAWASQRKEVLAGVFFGLTLLCYSRWRERPSAARYAGILGALTLGLLSKPTLVTLPFVLLLLDDWPLARLRGADGRIDPGQLRRAIVEKLPFFALVGAIAVITWVVQTALGAQDALAHLPFHVRLGNALVAYVEYLRSAFWPSGLIVDYPHRGAALSMLWSATCGAALALITLGAWRDRTRRPYVLVGWLWFLGTLVPMIGLIQVGEQARADRYTYLPLTGIAIALCWTLADLARSERARRAATALALSAIAALALVAHGQVRHWRDTISLFQRALSVAPYHATAHHRLGVAYVQQANLASAEEHYDEFFRLAPDKAYPRFEWGSVLEHNGRLDEALLHYDRGAKIAPNYARGRGHLALALQRSGRAEESIRHFEFAIAAHDNAPDLRRGAAHALAALSRHAEALQQRRAWLRLEPDSASAANELAWALATCPDASLRSPEQAVALIVPVSARLPDDPNLLDTLAAAYAASERFEEAIRAAEAALRANPEASLRSALAERLAGYRRGESYIDRR